MGSDGVRWGQMGSHGVPRVMLDLCVRGYVRIGADGFGGVPSEGGRAHNSRSSIPRPARRGRGCCP
eukprot:807665-Prymnesium_polylepis.1